LAAQVGNGVRTYRLSNILDLGVTDESFERPADFDLASWWQASTKRFEKELAVDTAQLRVTPAGLKALRDLGASVAQAAEASATAPDAAGWRRVTIPIESIPHAAAQVLRLGAQAEVLKPAALRRALLDRVRTIAALYAD
jgi:predicted DNA-binding transcriptional regulator YafY